MMLKQYETLYEIGGGRLQVEKVHCLEKNNGWRGSVELWIRLKMVCTN
jgi:hypothetical protein